ncbi:hypothetical protein K493DRAFT_314522 [Basidiobolus meristosporus CBS 931.73]|uniref:RNI-like protein n=1 Tax=Basidiobolus meristosporus CBS 931.73 TaxID=1314790 RepID=A0A1Y1YFB7_9FUNG|nr:hypothetical protein K493DRAFT_314522 [Basidiobolus meristosporus CBS 931.73]|eukprot:ORX96396.1 hypothetical protein K493DRAFT_314522 [Basidiobolus meristosporus CBS 931.73]
MCASCHEVGLHSVSLICTKIPGACCVDLSTFGAEEQVRISQIQAICVPRVDYLTKIYSFLHKLVVQFSASLDEESASHNNLTRDYKPLYPYLDLARSVNLARIQESLRFVNANPNPLWCYDYSAEEALVDKKITQHLWAIFRNKNPGTIRKLAWKGMVPLRSVFLDNKALSDLRDLELRWIYDPTSSRSAEVTHFKTLFASSRKLQRISLHIDPWVEKIEDRDIADLVSLQDPGSLKSLHVKGTHHPLVETIDALLYHHQHSLRELHISDYFASEGGLERIGEFSQLKSLKFHDCHLSDQEFSGIVGACKNLRELHLCKLPNLSCSVVRQIIETAGSNLQKLVISQIGHEILDVETVYSLVRFAKNLRHLDIQKMTFPAAEMCQFIESTPQLEYVALGEPIGNTPSSGDLIIKSVMGNCPKLS